MAIAPRTRNRLWALALAALGVLAIAWLVREAGAEQLSASLDLLLPWLPVLLLLEAVRIALELAATASVLGEHAGRVPLGTLVRAQLVGNSVMMSMPAGRPAGEAVKAVLLAPHVGAGRAFAVGVVGQSLTLIVNGLFALVAWWIAVDRGVDPTFVLALGSMGLFTLFLGLGSQVAARSTRLGRVVGRIERARIFVERFRSASGELALVPTRPILFVAASRGFQVAQLALLLHVFGIRGGVTSALLAQGVYLLGAAAGDLVPAQLGVVDSAFALAAPLLGASVPVGIAIAIAVHLAQLAWVAVGAFVGVVVRGAPDPLLERTESADALGSEESAAVAVAPAPSTPPLAPLS